MRGRECYQVNVGIEGKLKKDDLGRWNDRERVKLMNIIGREDSNQNERARIGIKGENRETKKIRIGK